MVERVEGFLFAPSRTFDACREDMHRDVFIYYATLAVVYAILLSVMALIEPIAGLPSLAHIWMFGDLSPLSSAAISISAVIIAGLWMHIWVYLLGGKNGVAETMNAMMYGATPAFVLSWIPYAGMVGMAWAIVVQIIGIRQLHEISTERAIGAYAISLAIPLIIFEVVMRSVYKVTTIP
jgi:hypothetical protein